MNLKKFQYNKPFELESGKHIDNLEIAYTTYGRLNAQKDNVVWVCHALTANSNVLEWWPGLFGENDYFNPEKNFIICANTLGSPYGTTNPLSINPATKEPYYLSFPQFSTRDLASAHQLLAEHLQIPKISILIGGSLGGQQALEWAVMEPNRIDKLIILATNAQHSPWGIAFNESQRLAIASDPTFYENTPEGGLKGLKTARSIALLSYRAYETYGCTQLETDADITDNYRASSYQNYQGEKLIKRFNAYSYWFLSKTMDSHHLGRKRKGIIEALQCIQAKTLIIGIRSDILFPPEEQKFLAEHIPYAQYAEIDSFYGHDGFLIETKALTEIIKKFVSKNYSTTQHSTSIFI